METVEEIFGFIAGVVMMIIRLAIFLVLSIIVLPSMAVMLTLHGPWESMLDGVYRLNSQK